MDFLFDHYKKTGYLHHAYLIEGAPSEVTPILVGALGRHLGIEIKNNPDLTIIYNDSFGIDEARMLSEMQSRAAFGGTQEIVHKFFIIGTNSLTREAQTALLKTFEEPTAGTHFFLIVPRGDAILPTLKSRVVLIDGRPTSAIGDDAKKIADQLLDSAPSDRFALIKKITETKKGESVDREMIRRILDHVERILYTRMAGMPSQEIFREIYQAKTYLINRGSSPKMLLEHVVMVLP